MASEDGIHWQPLEIVGVALVTRARALGGLRSRTPSAAGVPDRAVVGTKELLVNHCGILCY